MDLHRVCIAACAIRDAKR